MFMCERRRCGVSFIIRSGNSDCAYGDRVCRAHDDLLCWYACAYVTNILLYRVYGWWLSSAAALTLLYCAKLVFKSFFFYCSRGGGFTLLMGAIVPLLIKTLKKKHGYLSKISSFLFLKRVFINWLKISVG